MISILDSNKNVGIILMFTGFVLFGTAIYCFFTENDTTGITESIGDLIMGEVVFFTGIGIYMGKSVNHFLNMFDDCKTRTGIMCCMSAGFGLAFLIYGVFSIASKDSVNAIGNIVSGAVLLIGSWIATNRRGVTLGRVFHIIMCVASVILLITLFAAALLYMSNAEFPHMLAVFMDAIILLVIAVYLLDKEVSREMWGHDIYLLGHRSKH